MRSPARIAILGATGHIARNLIDRIGGDPGRELFLFARDGAALRAFLASTDRPRSFAAPGFDAFASGDYDAIVNCTGMSDPRKLGRAGAEIFLLTERFDDLAIEYLERHAGTRYVAFSSGAVYGRDFDSPASDDGEAAIAVNRIGPLDFYRIAKLNSEAKHRALSGLSVIDLRVFGFFSRHADLSSPMLVPEMVLRARDGDEFVTTQDELFRDYVSPDDLAALVLAAISSSGLNAALDVYSRGPTSKSELIEAFVRRYGLKVRYLDEGPDSSPTGRKARYYSESRAAAELLGYSPARSALDAVVVEADAVLRR